MARPGKRRVPKTEKQKQKRDYFLTWARNKANKQVVLKQLLPKRSLIALEHIQNAKQKGEVADKKWLKIAQDTILERGISIKSSLKDDLCLITEEKKITKTSIPVKAKKKKKTKTPIPVKVEKKKITKTMKGYTKEQLEKIRHSELVREEIISQRKELQELKRKCTFSVCFPSKFVSLKDGDFKEVMQILSEAESITTNRPLGVKCETAEAAAALKNELLDLPESKSFSILPLPKHTQTKATTSTDKKLKIKKKYKKTGMKIRKNRKKEVKDKLLKCVYLYNLSGVKKDDVEVEFPEAKKVQSFMFKLKEDQTVRVTRVKFPKASQAEQAAARESVVLNNKEVTIRHMTKDAVEKMEVKSGLRTIEAELFLAAEKKEPNKLKQRWSKEMKKTALAIRDPEKEAKKKLALKQRSKVLIHGKAGSVKNVQEVVVEEKKKPKAGKIKKKHMKTPIREYRLPKNAKGKRVPHVTQERKQAIMARFLLDQKIAVKPVLN